MSAERAAVSASVPIGTDAPTWPSGADPDTVAIFLPLAKSIAQSAVSKRRHQWRKEYLQEGDIVQDLSVKLIELIARYDERRGTPLQEYLARYLWWHVGTLLDSECERVDLSSEYTEDAVCDLQAEGCRRVVGPQRVSQLRPPALTVEGRWAARDSLKHLTTEDAEVVYLYYWEGFTQAEIAERTGRPQSGVSRALKRAIKKLGTILHK